MGYRYHSPRKAMPNLIQRALARRRAINEELRAEEQRRGDLKYFARLEREAASRGGFRYGASVTAESSPAPPPSVKRLSPCGSRISREVHSELREIVGYTTVDAIRTVSGAGDGFGGRSSHQYRETTVIPIYAPVGSLTPVRSIDDSSSSSPVSALTMDPRTVKDRAREHAARHNRQSLAQWRPGRVPQPAAVLAPQRPLTSGRTSTVRRPGSPHTIAEPEWVHERDRQPEHAPDSSEPVQLHQQ
ncbi:hypothetical protein LTS01_010842 [Friedmanniomyces endolithicus]|nr:hypothetical protein LTS01_010842 [Friedmanniomyces endolithicus]